MYRTLTHRSPNSKEGKKFDKTKFLHFAFYMCFMIVPIVHFFVFYLYVNINSFVMAFQNYTLDYDLGRIVTTFSGWDNFVTAWGSLDRYPTMFKNSVIFICIDLFVSQPLALLASYYIYKKKPGSAFFRTILYLPQVLSSVILGILFKYVIQSAIPEMLFQWFGVEKMDILKNPDTQLGIMVLFNIVMSFGVNVLLYSNAMGNVNPALIESASLEGANTISILWHVVLPKIYPTIVSLAIVIVSQVFTSQFQVFNIYGEDAGAMANVGYFIYLTSLNSDVLGSNQNYISYPALAAFGLSLTAIIVPVTFLVKFLLNRFGPKED